MRAERLGESVPVVGLHVVLRASAERLVGPDDHACRLGDVMFRREDPEVVDTGRAGSVQRLSPAAIVEEQHLAAIFQHSFMARRHGDATSVGIIIHVGEGDETNHAGHPGIVANPRCRPRLTTHERALPQEL